MAESEDWRVPVTKPIPGPVPGEHLVIYGDRSRPAIDLEALKNAEAAKRSA